MNLFLQTFCKAQFAKNEILIINVVEGKRFYQTDVENLPTTRALSNTSDRGKLYAG